MFSAKIFLCALAAIAVLANVHLPAALAAPEITLSPATGGVGAVVEVDSSGFAAFLPVHLSFGGIDLGSANPTVSGKFHTNFEVPEARHGDAIVTATNSVGASASATFSVQNAPPVAHEMQVTVNGGAAADIALNATDANGDPLTFAIVQSPHGGALATGATPGAVTYTPNANFSGPDSFTFKANDGKSDSNVSTVNMSVAAVDDPPTAGGSTATVAEDASVTMTLVANDIDSASVTFTIASPPAHGRLDGLTQTSPMSASVTYYPNANYNGDDSFTFQASDGTYSSNVATAAISISPVNDAPTISDLQRTVDQGATTLTLAASDVDTTALTFSIVQGPQKGTLGPITNTGSQTATVVYTPKDGQSGPDSFSFMASDGSLQSSVATALLTINAAAPPPSQNTPPAPAPPPPATPPSSPQSPKSSQVGVADALAVQDSILPDATITPSTEPEPGAQQTKTATDNGNENTPASFPSVWLVCCIIGVAGAAGGFLAYRRLRAQKTLDESEPQVAYDSPAPIFQQTAVVKEAHRIFSMLGDERSKAARKQVYEVAFVGAPAGASYESSRTLLKEQFGQISRAVMSDPLLNAMFMDSFAEIAIRVWRALAKGAPGDPGLEPVAVLGREAEKYWAEHDREPIVV